MKNFDTKFLSFIYSPVIPILLFLIGWWGSLPFFQDNLIFMFAILGLIIGIIINKIFLNKFISIGYNQKTIILITIYLFYSIGIFGFFMGVPVFNALLGIIASIYTTRKTIMNNEKEEILKKNLNNTALFCSSILLFFCICSAYLALKDPYTGENIKGMLGLNFEVTETIIYGIIIIGGLILLALQYFLVILIGKKSFHYFLKKE